MMGSDTTDDSLYETRNKLKKRDRLRHTMVFSQGPVIAHVIPGV